MTTMNQEMLMHNGEGKELIQNVSNVMSAKLRCPK